MYFYLIIFNIINLIYFYILVNNDNIVRLIDVFECDGKLHLIMEYCQGGDLRALIRKKLHEEEYFSYSQVNYQGSAGPETDCQGRWGMRTFLGRLSARSIKCSSDSFR